jgi:hypothetical protein
MFTYFKLILWNEISKKSGSVGCAKGKKRRESFLTVVPIGKYFLNAISLSPKH